ncbi:unnamed protein product, partial [Polarella glacialis]
PFRPLGEPLSGESAAAYRQLLGDSLLASDGEAGTEVALGGAKAVALCFSGHWCLPCREYTPILSKLYTEALRAKGLEAVRAKGQGCCCCCC